VGFTPAHTRAKGQALWTQFTLPCRLELLHQITRSDSFRAVTEAQSRKSKSKRKKLRAGELSNLQATLVFVGAAIVLVILGLLAWRGFPVGKTVMPMVVGTAFVAMSCYNVRRGLITWKGGGTTYRRARPFEFWFWITVFILVGLLAIFAGATELLKKLKH
jgi:hypothetical protein